MDNIMERTSYYCGRCCCCRRMSGEGYIEITEITPLISTSDGFLQHPCFNNFFDKIWLTCLVIVLISGTCIGVYLITIEGDDEFSTPTVVSKNSWHYSPPVIPEDIFILPYHKVLILQTSTDSCYNTVQCVHRLKHLREVHMMNFGEPDILYNFIVGGDGRIYEGRGWYRRNEQDKEEYLTVALLGNFTNNPPSTVQKNALTIFLNYAVNMNKLEPCFQIITEHHTRRYLVDLASSIEKSSIFRHLC